MTKKVMNDPNDIVEESMAGLMKAYPGYYQKSKKNCVLYKSPERDKVSLVSGGGSGHEPMLTGLIGENMLSAVAVGNVFTSPDPKTILDAIEEVGGDKGVLNLVWNYDGDRMNFDAASEFAEMKGLIVDTVIVNDDIASAPKDRGQDRRGVAGILLVTKLAGAKASEGASLPEVKAVAEKAVANTRTIGIALTPCSIPGKPENFEIADDEYEYGMGIHGEPGMQTEKMTDVKTIVKKMMDQLLTEFEERELHEKEVILFINGMAATTSLEMFLVNEEANQYLADKQIKIYDNIVGKYCSSLEMAGISITLMVVDEDQKPLYDLVAKTPFYSRYI
ncbi:dihydroxyacetone kinase subunit DhaK [Enterococcus alishanensis]